MKKFWLIGLLLTMVTTAFAQDQAVAKIKFSETEHAFGDIYQGDKVEHAFVIENTGTAPLVISNVSTTCGCTAPQWPREPIAPGESAEMLIQFDSRGKMGMQNKTITVFSNAEEAKATVRIISNVLPKPQDGR